MGTLPGLGQEASGWAGRGLALSTVRRESLSSSPSLGAVWEGAGLTWAVGLWGQADLQKREGTVKWKTRRWAQGSEPGLSSPALCFHVGMDPGGTEASVPCRCNPLLPQEAFRRCRGAALEPRSASSMPPFSAHRQEDEDSVGTHTLAKPGSEQR